MFQSVPGIYILHTYQHSLRLGTRLGSGQCALPTASRCCLVLIVLTKHTSHCQAYVRWQELWLGKGNISLTPLTRWSHQLVTRYLLALITLYYSLNDYENIPQYHTPLGITPSVQWTLFTRATIDWSESNLEKRFISNLPLILILIFNMSNLVVDESRL